jgi:hypothetical protein
MLVLVCCLDTLLILSPAGVVLERVCFALFSQSDRLPSTGIFEKDLFRKNHSTFYRYHFSYNNNLTDQGADYTVIF